MSDDNRGPVSDERFLQSALEGGASRHYVSGNVPDRGFMVGGATNGGNIPYPEIKHPVDSVTLGDIRSHARAIRDHFGEDAQIFQGAWREGDHIVLDASEMDPTYSSAITKAKMRGERAIYDVRRGKDRYTGDAHPKN